jgi:EAL domain-containing protein (putative c-di-GMP-specific phosphodiesterase class I)
VEHVDEAQGYLLARPLTATTFRDTILNRTGAVETHAT